MAIILMTFTVVFVIVVSTGLLMVYREAVLARLANVVAPQSSQRRWWQLLTMKQTAVENIISPFERVLPRSPEEVSVQQKRLMRAGLRQPNHVNIYYGLKVLTPL